MHIVSRQKNEIIAVNGDDRILISGISDSCIRVVVTGRSEIREDAPVEVSAGSGCALNVEEKDGILAADTGRLSVSVTEGEAGFEWRRKDTGDLLFREKDKVLKEIPILSWGTGGEAPVIKWVDTVDGKRSFVENLRAGEDHKGYEAEIYFDFREDETIHGLGQGEEGIYDYRGKLQYLYQHNMRIPIPFFVSDRGYGVFVNCGSTMIFDDRDGRGMLKLNAVEQLDYYVSTGNCLDEIIGTYRELTGSAAMLPKWAFGYIQSKERYETQDELVFIAKEYRKRGVGLDCVVQDWKTWTGDNWGYKTPDPKRYPDLQKMQDELHGMNVHSMVSVWPNTNEGTPDWQEMNDAGFLLYDLATYDAFNEEARALYWKHAKRGLFAPGFDSWWCDSTEPFPGPDWNGPEKRSEEERFRIVGGEHDKFLGPERANLYATAHAKGIFENQRKTAPDMRVLNLTRSGYSSIQKYGTVLWSGDISARWDVLRKQITEGLNMGLSGMPWWTLDAGAFFTVHEKWQNRGCGCNNDPEMKWFWHGDYEEGVNDPAYRELYVRWLQMAVFLPVFRSHGTDTPREIWNFGEKGEPFYDAIAEAIALRYRLMPYIYSLAGRTHTDHYTMMRSLLFDFAEDKTAAALHDEYMFGDSLLVCPVTEPMYYEKNGVRISDDEKNGVRISDDGKSGIRISDGEKNGSRISDGQPGTRRCYLPKGTSWYDFYTGEQYEGGTWIEAKAPISRIPVFVKAGSVIPMEKGLSYAEEAPDTPLEVHIYPGRDGEFLYYEDDGNTYEYEEGRFNLLKMEWKESEETLNIEPCSYEFPGGIKGRMIEVVIGPGK